jgi:short-subunit dehydrogenase
MNLKGKTVLLTGASGGIGAAIAQALAGQGVRLVITGRNIEKLNKLQQQLNELSDGVVHAFLAADLTLSSDRQKLKQLAKDEAVDVLINSAGVNQLALLEQMDDAEISAIIEMNLTVPMMVCKDFVPLLSSRKESAIVNVGSILGSIGFAGSSGYCAAKFGLRGFTEALRRELADSSVKVVYFAPRATDTDINDTQIVAMNDALGSAVDSPELVADCLIQTLQKTNPHNRYLGWPEVFFVRLNSIFPKLVDGALFKQLSIIRRFAQR